MNAAGPSCRVRVPATTANLGPGFDCLGLALDLWNDVTFTLEGRGVAVTVESDYPESLPRDESNLVAQSYLRLCEEAGKAPPAGLHIHCPCACRCPPGSAQSMADCFAGVLGANTLLGRPLKGPASELVADIEGHPDNVAAALLAASPSSCARATRC